MRQIAETQALKPTPHLFPSSGHSLSSAAQDWIHGTGVRMRPETRKVELLFETFSMEFNSGHGAGIRVQLELFHGEKIHPVEHYERMAADCVKAGNLVACLGFESTSIAPAIAVRWNYFVAQGYHLEAEHVSNSGSDALP